MTTETKNILSENDEKLLISTVSNTILNHPITLSKIITIIKLSGKLSDVGLI